VSMSTAPVSINSENVERIAGFRVSDLNRDSLAANADSSLSGAGGLGRCK